MQSLGHTANAGLGFRKTAQLPSGAAAPASAPSSKAGVLQVLQQHMVPLLLFILAIQVDILVAFLEIRNFFKKDLNSWPHSIIGVVRPH